MEYVAITRVTLTAQTLVGQPSSALKAIPDLRCTQHEHAYHSQFLPQVELDAKNHGYREDQNDEIGKNISELLCQLAMFS